MRCPRCNDPMPQTRHEPGKYKVFSCSRCGASKKKSEGYGGQIVINSRVPVKHQEEG